MKLYLLIIAALILIVILSLYRIDYFSVKEQKGQGYYIGNLHTHTTASDGANNYNQMVDEAVNLGFDFIAITDHNTIGPTTKLLCPIDKRIFCIVGEEISTSDGHLLALGITKTIPKGLSANETVRLIHEQGGLAVPAHPGGVDSIKPELFDKIDFDAVECNSSVQPEQRIYGCNTIYSTVYNSDAHNTKALSDSANKCWLANLTLQSLKESIKAGNCTLYMPLTG